jgi:hypothetical protein
VAHQDRKQQWWKKGKVGHNKRLSKWRLKQISKGRAKERHCNNDCNYLTQGNASLPSLHLSANQNTWQARKDKYHRPE